MNFYFVWFCEYDPVNYYDDSSQVSPVAIVFATEPRP